MKDFWIKYNKAIIALIIILIIAFSSFCLNSQSVDSLKNQKLHEMELRVIKLEAARDSYSDNIQFYSIGITVVVGFLVGLFTLATLLSNKINNKKIEILINNFKVEYENFRENYKKDKIEIDNYIENIPNILERLNDIRNLSLRSFYEFSAKEKPWGIVWLIRYIDWFVDNINDNIKNEGKLVPLKTDLIINCNNLEKNYKILKTKVEDYDYFINFPNKEGLITILKKLINTDIKEVIPIATEILGDFYGKKVS